MCFPRWPNAEQTVNFYPDTAFVAAVIEAVREVPHLLSKEFIDDYWVAEIVVICHPHLVPPPFKESTGKDTLVEEGSGRVFGYHFQIHYYRESHKGNMVWRVRIFERDGSGIWTPNEDLQRALISILDGKERTSTLAPRSGRFSPRDSDVRMLGGWSFNS